MGKHDSGVEMFFWLFFSFFYRIQSKKQVDQIKLKNYTTK